MEDKTAKRLKVGFLFPHPLSYSLGSTSRLFSLVVNLKKIGFDVVILTPFEKNHAVDGIPIINVPSFFSKIGLGNLSYRVARKIFSNKILCRLFLKSMMLTSSLNSNFVNVLEDLNLDILQIEHEPTAAALLPILKTLSLPLVLDFQGVWAEELVESGVITKECPEYRALQDSVTKAVSKIDAIIVMSEPMKNYVVNNYKSDASKIHVIKLSTGIKTEQIAPKISPPKVVYAGILAKEKNANVFLDSIPYIVKKQPSTQFYITNKGDLVDKARSIAKSCGANIEFFWFSDLDQMFKLMSTCNVGVLTLPNNDSYKLSPAAKFFDYLSVGLPVVSNDIGGWTSLIGEEKVGLLTKNDPLYFSEAILKILDNQTLADTYGKNGLELLKHQYDATEISKDLAKVYCELDKKKQILGRIC